jgi:hypothetical protein
MEEATEELLQFFVSLIPEGINIEDLFASKYI